VARSTAEIIYNKTLIQHRTTYLLNITKYITCVYNLQCRKQEEGRMGARIFVGAIGKNGSDQLINRFIRLFRDVDCVCLCICKCGCVCVCVYETEKNSILVRQSYDIFLFFCIYPGGRQRWA